MKKNQIKKGLHAPEPKKIPGNAATESSNGNLKANKPEKSLIKPKDQKYKVDFPHRFKEDQLLQFKEIFIFFDRNADGLISTEELGVALRSLGFLVSTIDVLEIIKKIDPNNTREIDIRRFFQAISQVQSRNNEENEEALRKAFQGFDKENSGKVEVKEFKKILMTLGDVLQENEIDYALRHLSLADGNFNIEEMLDLLMLKRFKK